MSDETTTRSWTEVVDGRGFLSWGPELLATWMEENATFYRFLTEIRDGAHLGGREPTGRLLDVGSGPGRHASGAAALGWDVLSIDIDESLVDQARRNAARAVPDAAIRFEVGDMWDLRASIGDGRADVVTSGGLLEHLDPEEEILRALDAQLAVAPLVVFDVPVGTDRNLALFDGDGIFRQIWSPDRWLQLLGSTFDILGSAVEERTSHPTMTDDLVVMLTRS